MSSRLQQLFDLLERDRKALLRMVSLLPPERWHRAPEGKWSISQILAHVVTAERLSLLYMKKKILGVEQTGTTGAFEELKMLVLKLSQRLPLRFKAPAVVVQHTRVYDSVADAIEDWDQERSKLKAFLETVRPSDERKKIYRHIRAGMLNVRQALIFIREHQIHHTPQIRRLL